MHYHRSPEGVTNGDTASSLFHGTVQSARNEVTIMDFIWWVEKFELPALGFLGAWNLRLQGQIAKAASASEQEEQRKHMDTQMNLMREDLTDFKLSAAKEYVPSSRIETIEDKIERRFDRLEEKLDGVLARR